METKLQEDNADGRYSPKWWAFVAQDLADYDAQRSQTWGSVDENLLACYAAGKCTHAERVRVEQAMQDHPAVRESVEIAREFTDGKTPPAGGDFGQIAQKVQPNPDRNSGPSR